MAFNPSDKKKKNSSETEEHNIFASSTKSTFAAKTVSGPAVYHLGIVDFLQDWTFKKRLERAFKTYVTRKDPDGLSVMEPTAYKLRFQSKMDQIFDMDGTGGGIGWSKESGSSSSSGSGGISSSAGAGESESSALLTLPATLTTPLKAVRSSSSGMDSVGSGGGEIELSTQSPSQQHPPHIPTVKITTIKHVTKVIGSKKSKRSMDASDETTEPALQYDPDATVVVETTPSKTIVTATKTSTELIPKSTASPQDESEYIAVGGFNDVDLC